MSGNTKLKGRPVKGDRIQWTWYNTDLTGWMMEGTVVECTGEVGKIKTDKGEYYLVPHVLATVVINHADMVDQLAQQLKMISTLDQGCGGNATEKECWRQAQAIALDAIARLT